MKPPIRIGIIGLGGYAGAHHNSVVQLEAQGHARLVCTCDPQAEAFAAQQESYEFARRGVKVFADYRPMLEAHGHELDMLVVPTPISLHAEMHRAGVERGIAVYLEKPPTLDYRELERMIATDRTAKKTTLVGFNFIIEKARLALKQRIISGEFGPLRETRLNAQWPRPYSYFARNNWAGRLLAPDGGVVLDSCFGNAMAHFVHNLLFWAGDSTLMSWGQPETARAELYRAHAIEGADTFFVESRTTSGVVMRFALTHACEGASLQTETVVCEKASIHYIVGQHAEIRWNDGRVEPVALEPFNALHENHLDYYRYLRGETSRPATTLVDSRPFVVLNNLAYVSSGEITPFPAGLVKSITHPHDAQNYLAVDGLPDALADFLAHGRWPGSALGWRTGSPAALVTPADLPRFIPTLEALAAR
ncbi:Gfo/Idh/MocA family protein [Rariglobus hedericola]|uniref:Gfo/Idh/MocA family oxidoreductase n=1 Tax=Rariglobus hedericola TaxID=2597822 RepID=A0A556QLJ5_9BACT|nr:Gfo/Idh/MocA family oxidoreductase [Rariglobus hedericola]TSJ77516.1 Gfo/Idh/MocA family oxidoreductase [Rariglobus hedericola]